MEQEAVQGLPEMWAVVGLFGHTRVAGKVTTQALGGACLLRVDTPAYKIKKERYDSYLVDEISKEKPRHHQSPRRGW